MREHGFRIRLTGRQIINWSLLSCVIEIVVLIALRREPGHGAAPASTWAIAMLVPALDVLLGLRVWQVTRRVALARFPFAAGLILALFAAYTVWSWR